MTTMADPIQSGSWEIAMPDLGPPQLPPSGEKRLPPAHVVIGWYLEEKKGAWSDSTLARNVTGLKVFERWLNGRPLNRQRMVEYRDYLANYRNGGVTQQEWVIAGGFIRWLVRNRWVDPSVIDSISPPPRKKPPERPPIRDTHYQKLMEAPINPKVRWLVRLMHHTGLALVDAMGLKSEEVDLEQMVITKARQKTRAFTRPCIIPLDPNGELAQALLEQNERTLGEERRIQAFRPHFKRSEYVDEDAQRMREGNRWKRAWNEARELAGIDRKYSPHCFRRGFVTKLVEGGVNPVIGCSITGHSNPATFMKYATMDPERVREEMERALSEAAMRRINNKVNQ